MSEEGSKLMYPIKFIWFSISRLYLWILLLSAIFVSNYWFEFIIFTSAFIGIPYIIYIYLSYVNTSYSFDHDKIIKRHGIIVKRSSAIQFNKIQNIDLRSDLMMRVFQISLINIWTASQSQLASSGNVKKADPEICLFLDTNEAEKLRAFIIDKDKRDKISSSL